MRKSLLTDREEMVLEELGRQGSVKACAWKLQLAPETIYNVLFRVRIKLMKSQNTVNKINSLKREFPCLRRLLTPIVRVELAEEKPEEDWERKWENL